MPPKPVEIKIGKNLDWLKLENGLLMLKFGRGAFCHKDKYAFLKSA
jgi:hypothetical protein